MHVHTQFDVAEYSCVVKRGTV